MRSFSLLLVCLMVLSQALLLTGECLAGPASTRLVSGDIDSNSGTGGSMYPSISSNGRYVAFVSTSSNLGFPSGFTSVYLYDRRTRTVEHAVKPLGGGQPDDSSSYAAISRNGRFLALHSYVATLVADDIENGYIDVYVYDLRRSTYEKVSVTSSEEHVSGTSFLESISDNGRFVLFSSESAELDGLHSNGKFAFFVRDRRTGTTAYLNVGTGGADPDESLFATEQSISANGRFVAFESQAANILPGSVNPGYSVYVFDRKKGITRRLSVDTSDNEAIGQSFGARITNDGKKAFFTSSENLTADDTNGRYDIFVRNLRQNRTKRVLVGPGGTELSGPVYLRAISSEGRFIVYATYSAELPGTENGTLAQLFLFDRNTKRLKLLSANTAGEPGNTSVYYDASVSDNGRFTAFDSAASNLAGTDVNNAVDVFLRDRGR